MKILILHCMGIKSRWIEGVADVELMFSKYDQSNQYLTHNSFITLPNYVKKLNFDAVFYVNFLG